MADPTNVYDVWDSFVKVIGGALAGGVMTLLGTYIMKRKDIDHSFLVTKRSELKGIVLKIDEFDASFQIFRSNFQSLLDKRNAHKKDSQKTPPTSKEKTALKALDSACHDNFTILNQSKALLALLGETESEKKLESYGQLAVQIYKMCDLSDDALTPAKLSARMRKLKEARKNLMETLHQSYKT